MVRSRIPNCSRMPFGSGLALATYLKALADLRLERDIAQAEAQSFTSPEEGRSKADYYRLEFMPYYQQRISDVQRDYACDSNAWADLYHGHANHPLFGYGFQLLNRGYALYEAGAIYQLYYMDELLIDGSGPEIAGILKDCELLPATAEAWQVTTLFHVVVWLTGQYTEELDPELSGYIVRPK